MTNQATPSIFLIQYSVLLNVVDCGFQFKKNNDVSEHSNVL